MEGQKIVAGSVHEARDGDAESGWRLLLPDSHPGVIESGVRQEFPISPLLFSIYAEAMMIEALEDMKEVLLQGSWL